MKLTDVEKNTLLRAIRFARESLPWDPDDPYRHLMTDELLEACETEVQELAPDNGKYLAKSVEQ